MDENPSTDPPAKRRRRFPKPALVAGGVVIGLLTPYVVASAAATFPDVPESHAFYDEVEWLNDTQITTGFPDGTFRPSQAVTRGNMAAFMQRLYDVQDDMSWNAGNSSVEVTSNKSFTDVPAAQTSVAVPEGVHANISARFTAESLCPGGAGTWCSVRIVISEDGGPFTEMYPVVGTDSAFDGGGADQWESHAIERLGFGWPGSVYTIKVQATRWDASSFQLDDWTLVAETDLQPSDYEPS
jgi:hypothetical protein